MLSKRIRLSGLAGFITVTAILCSFDSRTWPGYGSMPTNMTTGLPSCGLCHSLKPNAFGTVSIKLTGDVSIPVGKTITGQLSVSGGPSATTGGFSMDTTMGTFASGTNTASGNSGKALANTSKSFRTWNFKFSSKTTGLAKWHTVAMASNGKSSAGDSWGFFGPNTSIAGTPYRVFVNDSAVTPFGNPCPGSHGFKPLLGMAKNAVVNGSFSVELHNAPAGTVAVCTLGFSKTSWGAINLPLNLTGFGATGCSLLVSPNLLLNTVTSGIGPGNGQAILKLAVPNDTVLRNASLHFQGLVFDVGANSLNLTTTNGLTAVIQ